MTFSTSLATVLQQYTAVGAFDLSQYHGFDELQNEENDPTSQQFEQIDQNGNRLVDLSHPEWMLWEVDIFFLWSVKIVEKAVAYTVNIISKNVYIRAISLSRLIAIISNQYIIVYA